MFFNIPSFTAGFAVGFGSGFLTREIVSGVKTLRPAAKSVVRASLVALETSRERLSYVSESLEDLLAEARAEASEKKSQKKLSKDSTKGSAGRTETKKHSKRSTTSNGPAEAAASAPGA